MGLIVKEGGTILPPIPEGVYQGVCYGIYDLGTQFSEKWGKSKHQCIVIWEIPEVRIEVIKDEKTLDLPRVTSKRYTMSLSEKANLRKDLQSWRGRVFTPEELQGFDITKLLGANCMLQIIHNVTNNQIYANVAAVLPLYKGMQKKAPENPMAVFSMADHSPIPESTPDWIVELIKESAEWKSLEGELSGSQMTDDDVPF